MRYSTHLYNTKKASVVIPVFCDETGDKREGENVKRMNDFYSELKRAVFAYTESDTFPEGAKYFARAVITEENGTLNINMNLKTREKGKTLSQRTLTHVWNDGVVTEKRVK